MKVYAKPGEGLQQIGGECPEGWIEMSGERPAPELVAAESGAWTEVSAPAFVPAAVSRFQGRQAMRLTGRNGNAPEPGDDDLFSMVESLLQAEGTPPYYRTAWDEMQQFDRDSPMLQALADELGLADQDIDNLFRFAASLRA